MISTLKESGHPCDDSIIYRCTRGGGRTHRKMHSPRRALWRQFRVFGVDWALMEYREKIADIKHARRTTSKLKCKMNDAHERMASNLKLKSSKIDTQPRLSVKPRLCTCNIEARMLKKKRTGSYKLRASSKSKASTLSPNYILRTSPDDVTHFFFPYNRSGKVASRKKKARKKSSLTEEDLFCRKVKDFLYFLRKSRKRKKKKPRNGERRVVPSQNVFPGGNAKKRNVKLRKIRKKRKPSAKKQKERMNAEEAPVNQGPRYHISLNEVKKTYSRMRKGKGFYASHKVLWRNRHALCLGSSNFYRKVRDDDDFYYEQDNQEYDIVEPPEASPDPDVPTSGPQFSSDEAGDGPVQSNAPGSRKISEREDDCRDRSLIVDKLLGEIMINISTDLTESNILMIFKQLDGRDKIDDLKKLITKLECMIEKGQGNVCIRAMVRSKRKELNQRLCGTPPSTPPESEDEDGGELLEQCGVEDIF